MNIIHVVVKTQVTGSFSVDSFSHPAFTKAEQQAVVRALLVKVNSKAGVSMVNHKGFIFKLTVIKGSNSVLDVLTTVPTESSRVFEVAVKIIKRFFK